MDIDVSSYVSTKAPTCARACVPVNNGKMCRVDRACGAGAIEKRGNNFNINDWEDPIIPHVSPIDAYSIIQFKIEGYHLNE